MLHFELSQNQQRKHQQLTLQYDRISQQAAAFSEEKRTFVSLQSQISNIGASTRIENALLTDIEIEWIDTVLKTEPHLEYQNRERFIKNKLAKDKSRSIEEVAGYRNAIQLVFSAPEMFFPLSISQIKGLHREILRFSADANHYSGDFKKIPNTVIETNHATSQTRSVLKTAAPGIITETAMQDLLTWYNQEIVENSFTLAVAVELVFRFLAIHPFQDGNGRLSRLLMHIALLSPENSVFRASVPLCAIDRSIEQTRKKYYEVLQRCSGGIFSPEPGDYSYGFFLDYIFEMLLKSPAHFDHYCTKYDRYQALSATAVKVLDSFKNRPEQPVATRELMADLPIPRRTLIYSLNSLLEAGFIQRAGKGPGSRYRLIF
ncbi:MAG: hypothetical protein A2293_07355 [Elusimicrobia bacterium RIFOXYB2_FULL_49_7]|nr:MAG: hypothetical protein A2293_07355 [Elusimicrobia bacterium RIFOXYB2_FULL_49_7]